MKRRVRKTPFFWLKYTAAIAVLMFVANAVVVFVFMPIQAIFLPELAEVASLAFLPHGLKVLATVVLRANAVAGLFLGSLAANYLLWGMSDAGLLLAVSLVAGVTASIVFEFMNAFRVKVFYESVEDGQPLLQNLLLAGFLCSIANGLLMTAVLGMPAGITQIAYTMAAFVIGDCVGLLLAWVLARYAFDLLGVRER